MSVRERVKEIQTEVRRGDLTPLRAAELQAQLSALTGNISAEMTDAEIEFNDVLATYLKSEEKANRATILAKTSPQYRRAREAKDALKLAESMSTALRALMRAQQEEMRMTR